MLIKLNKVILQEDKNKLLIISVRKKRKSLVKQLLDIGAIPVDNIALVIACKKQYKGCFYTLLTHKYYDNYIGSRKCSGDSVIINSCMIHPISFIISGLLQRPIFKLPYYSLFLSACCKGINKTVFLLVKYTDIDQQRVGLRSAIDIGNIKCVSVIVKYSNWKVVDRQILYHAQSKRAGTRIVQLLNQQHTRRYSTG